MVAIAKRLLSLLFIAVATSLSVEPASAALTPFPVEYDALAMTILVYVGEMGAVVPKANPAISTQFGLFQKRAQDQAATGTLTSAEFVRLLGGFLAETDKIVPNFRSVLGNSLKKTKVESEEYVVRAPAYWADFVSGAWISAATSFNNAVLMNNVKAFVAQVEQDIKDRVSVQIILPKFTAFYAKAPGFEAAATKTSDALISKVDADFARAIAAAGGAAAPTTTTTTGTATPSANNNNTNTNSTTTTPTTAMPTTPATQAPTTAPPSVDKANATTTAPAATVKSGATTFAMGAISSLVVAVTLAVATAL